MAADPKLHHITLRVTTNTTQANVALAGAAVPVVFSTKEPSLNKGGMSPSLANGYVKVDIPGLYAISVTGSVSCASNPVSFLADIQVQRKGSATWDTFHGGNTTVGAGAARPISLYTLYTLRAGDKVRVALTGQSAMGDLTFYYLAMTIHGVA